jgi:hypothetical protein
LKGRKVIKTLCFKQRHINPETSLCESVDELEADFGNNDKVLKIFDMLNCDVFLLSKTSGGTIDISLYLEKAGYKECAKVEKNRALYKYQSFEIAIDELNGLPGAFIEIELKEKDFLVNEGKQKIYYFLRHVIGLDSIEEFNNDYLAMVQDSEKIVFKEIDLLEVLKK